MYRIEFPAVVERRAPSEEGAGVVDVGWLEFWRIALSGLSKRVPQSQGLLELIPPELPPLLKWRAAAVVNLDVGLCSLQGKARQFILLRRERERGTECNVEIFKAAFPNVAKTGDGGKSNST